VKKKFWHGNKLPFPILLDAKGTTARVYGVHSAPDALLIDPEGKVVVCDCGLGRTSKALAALKREKKKHDKQ